MSRSLLLRNLEMHRAYSLVIQGHLSRHWQRDLSESEISVVRSYMLCASFMSLESMDRRLASATSSLNAESEFSFIRAEVVKYSSAVVHEVQRRMRLTSSAPQTTAFPDLLSWEEALLEATGGL